MFSDDTLAFSKSAAEQKQRPKTRTLTHAVLPPGSILYQLLDLTKIPELVLNSCGTCGWQRGHQALLTKVQCVVDWLIPLA